MTTVTYVVSRWGEATQTFVRREADAVIAAGGRVRVVSLKRPLTNDQSIEVLHLGAAALALGAIVSFLRHPVVCFRTLGRTLAHSSARNALPHLTACLVGFAWAGRRAVRADLIQVHFGWIAATAAWAATRVTLQPYAVVLHAFELHTTRYLDGFTPIPLRDAVAVFTIAARDKDLVARRWDVDAEVLHMGVTDEWFRAGAEPGGRDPWLVVSVGSLVAKKGHADLVAAIALADPRWRLVVVGEGPERAAVAAAVTKHGLGGRVELAGALSEPRVRALVRQAGVFVLASVVTPAGDRDGIPVALMEAMACRTPVLTTRAGAIEELVADCGLIVAPGDPVALATALDSLRDGVLRAALAERGVERVAREFHATDGGARVLELARLQAR